MTVACLERVRCANPGCITILSRFNADPDGLCGPCRRAVTERELAEDAGTEYRIYKDPEAISAVCRLLLEGWRDHPGEPVLLGRALGTKDVVGLHVIIESLRRAGHIIDGEKGIPGYTYRGFRPPERWTHADTVMANTARANRVALSQVIGQVELLGEAADG